MDALKSKLVERNTKLVHYVVNRLNVPAALKDDIVSEGMLALVECAKRFDPDKGYKFATYAFPWIDGKCRRFLRESRSVKFGRKVIDSYTIMAQYCAKKGIHLTEACESDYEEAGVDIKLAQDIIAYASDIRLEDKIDSSDGSITIADCIVSDNISQYEWCMDSEESMFEVLDDFFKWYRQRPLTGSNSIGCDAFEDYSYNLVCGLKLTTNELADKYKMSQSYMSRILARVRNEFFIWLQERMVE